MEGIITYSYHDPSPLVYTKGNWSIVQEILMAYLKNLFFPWVLLILIINNKNRKRPVIMLLIVHWLLRSTGDSINKIMYFYDPVFVILKENAKIWYIGCGIANIFWMAGEIVGDWYPLIRTRAIVNNKKKVRIVYVTCLLYNLTKLYNIIFYFIEIPRQLAEPNMHGYQLRWWVIITFIFYLIKYDERSLDMEIQTVENIRRTLVNVNFALMYIDQILLIYYVSRNANNKSNYVSYNKSNHSINNSYNQPYTFKKSSVTSYPSLISPGLVTTKNSDQMNMESPLESKFPLTSNLSLNTNMPLNINSPTVSNSTSNSNSPSSSNPLLSNYSPMSPNSGEGSPLPISSLVANYYKPVSNFYKNTQDSNINNYNQYNSNNDIGKVNNYDNYNSNINKYKYDSIIDNYYNSYNNTNNNNNNNNNNQYSLYLPLNQNKISNYKTYDYY
ncbi:hypothetical protein PIROE2DRAFT_13489 [Piromyces sp. E2]|nr:hypothetical protein PIROE2DRAFT_13489 [Piromyces sp. E2]|eukprot:OUM60672.1 hypothetical protein PIROE2DRAFT_13489 [Piromyces sp. E2]